MNSPGVEKRWSTTEVMPSGSSWRVLKEARKTEQTWAKKPPRASHVDQTQNNSMGMKGSFRNNETAPVKGGY